MTSQTQQTQTPAKTPHAMGCPCSRCPLPAPKTMDLSVTLSGAGQRALSLLQRQGVSLSHLIEQALIEAACS